MRTRAAIGGHPVHAMLVHFPIAFLIGASGFDLVGVVVNDPSLHAIAHVLLPVGLVTAVVAAIPGIIDLVASIPKPSVEQYATIRHAVLSALSLSVFALAWAFRAESGVAPGVTALLLEAIGTVALFAAGRAGAALVLEHHVGASPAPPS